MEKSGTDTGRVTGNRATGQAKWTFMVYMAGDNNLDGAALRDIAEMARAGSTKDVNVLVQLDRLEDNLTRRFRITQGGGFKKDCIESFGDTNTGDPKILYDFVKWAADNYPADRYALILWNHGSGWWEEEKGKADDPVGRMPRRHLFNHLILLEHRSICYDDTSGGDALDNRELKGVLNQACAILGKKIDLLGMDACLMNMVEVAYQQREFVNIIVG
ncbi:peptidase C11, partial [Patescibacteria group bacterium]|nr:peptidase C11 [Patescibacteria group bacterium]